ncbi:MAG: DNA-binding domain-containing protein [Oleiphilaceae bacterium]|nr:DNA-binding domain-containing protein [Oleiphilaceae bacterium]
MSPKPESNALNALQDKFIHGLYQGEIANVEALICDSNKLSATQHFDIYHGSMLGNFTASLRAVFPRVLAALGDQFFDALARQYIKNHPSKTPILDDFGEGFPSFCEGFKPLHDYPYVSDVASVDWSWHQAFHSCDVSAVFAADLQNVLGVDQANIQLGLHPSVSIIRSDFPLYSLWQFNEQENASVDSNNGASFSLDAPAEIVMVWRQDYQVCVTSISLPVCALLTAFDEGCSPTQAFERAFEQLWLEQKMYDSEEALAAELSEAWSFLLKQGALKRL